MSELVFQPFPKMARLTRECVITEKIDGTNAQVFIVHSLAPEPGAIAHKSLGDAGDLSMFAGSRTRYITPDADNMGFAAWVKANAEQLWALGPGRHFGEWWGSKIQRGYGQPGGTKHFSLFNTSRWAQLPEGEPFDYMLDKGQSWAPACCRVVPELYRGMFSERMVEGVLTMLRSQGSKAAPGFADPEGIVIFHTHAGTLFKKTLDNDEVPKSKVAA